MILSRRLALATTFLLCCSTAFAAQFSVPESDSPSPVKGVDWYIDATASMQGFTRADRVTTYAYFTRLLEQRLHSLWAPSQIPYTLNRFGLTTATFPDLRNAWTPPFYAPVKGFEDTDLTVVARNLKPNHLTLILTDLFQSDSHIETFRSELLKHNLGKSLQFAAIGFKADFDGTIYDIPPSKSSRRYRGPRPVYALLLGDAAALKQLLDSVLEHHNDLGTPLNALMVSNRIGTPVTPFHDLQPPAFTANGLDPDSDLVAGGPQPFAKELRLSRSANQPAVDMKVPLTVNLYEAVPPLDSFHLDHRVWMCSTETSGLLDRLMSRGSSNGKQQACTPATRDYDIVYSDSSVAVQNTASGKLQVSVHLDLGKRNDAVRGVRARSGNVYIVRLSVDSTSATEQMPPWVASFNEDGRQTFDPARTPDLADFFSSMQDSVHSAGPVTLFDAYLFIDSK